MLLFVMFTNCKKEELDVLPKPVIIETNNYILENINWVDENLFNYNNQLLFYDKINVDYKEGSMGITFPGLYSVSNDTIYLDFENQNLISKYMTYVIQFNDSDSLNVEYIEQNKYIRYKNIPQPMYDIVGTVWQCYSCQLEDNTNPQDYNIYINEFFHFHTNSFSLMENSSEFNEAGIYTLSNDTIYLDFYNNTYRTYKIQGCQPCTGNGNGGYLNVKYIEKNYFLDYDDVECTTY